MQRDYMWLKNRLEVIWQTYFEDVKMVNNVLIKFGRPSSTRLGSIKLNRPKSIFQSPQEQITVITINGHFKNPQIPEYVVDAVLVHELTHYAHGFCSPHKKMFRHPHKNGVVKKEMVSRGLQNLLQLEKNWIKKNWRDFLKKQA